MSQVSRSVYQKVCEENKKLLKDIYILTGDIVDSSTMWEYMNVRTKWREKFTQDRELRELLHKAAIEYVKEHPELNIQLPSQEKQEP